MSADARPYLQKIFCILEAPTDTDPSSVVSYCFSAFPVGEEWCPRFTLRKQMGRNYVCPVFTCFAPCIMKKVRRVPPHFMIRSWNCFAARSRKDFASLSLPAASDAPWNFFVLQTPEIPKSIHIPWGPCPTSCECSCASLKQKISGKVPKGLCRRFFALLGWCIRSLRYGKLQSR